MAKDRSDEWLVGLFIGFGFGAAGVAGALAWVSSTLGAASIPIWAFAAGGAILVFRGPFGKAIAERMSRRADDPVELPAELYAELDELRARMGEMEERVEFSERLLTRQNGNSMEHS